MLDGHDSVSVSPPARDSVVGLDATEPIVVSISDIHGFLSEARSALLTLTDHAGYDPIVEGGPLRGLDWVGGDEYVLVFNGDLVDRGAHSDRVVEMVQRLIDQAPPGHVRVTLGNHEMGVLTPDWFQWEGWYSVERSDEERRAFARQILDGHVVAAYDGYHVTYAHAGRPEPYETRELNDALVDGTRLLYDAIGTDEDRSVQERLPSEFPAVFGVDGSTGRGPDAGVAWLDFEFMPEDAPPQVVGHTRQDEIRRRGNVLCQNVIRNNRRTEGGEGVVVETPDTLVSLVRAEDGSVVEYDRSVPASAD